MTGVRFLGLLAGCLLMLVSLFGCGSLPVDGKEKAAVTVLIDPGHGGMDGGTAAEDGTLEKNINLAISLYLRDILAVCGVPVAMTRESDISIHSPEAESTRTVKVSDMRNRLALYENAGVVIALHQNHFPAEKYHGTQVFYSANHPASLPLAESIRRCVLDALQPENTRELKKATNGIYLLYHTTRPAVLVECGFLSNNTERELLKTPVYQQKMALAIAGGYLTYLMQE